ncbi:hypothetical protein N7495_000284 [Penicillium taxi]|uniref:uncharacterized protein n=1 Tax=Penicillium taxi TaxID=168475 RepID=UPI002544D533|nr:uncharacterized protein N7495_000284 [Penicillium taxi]KAJ5907602.1 hypothetical protein N7495_000284 [Penicillium taxi]
MSDTAASDSNKSGDFSNTVQNEVKHKSGPYCWVCGAMNPEIAHVIGKKDRQTGLLTFELTSIFNGIPLCGLCHNQFDCDGDQGLIIVPTDLEFFIRHELEDQERRTTTEIGSGRKVPTNVVYHDQGGRFKPVFLKHARVSILDRDTSHQLAEIQTLYFEERTVNGILLNQINIQEARLRLPKDGNSSDQRPSNSECMDKKRPANHEEDSPSRKRMKKGNEDGLSNVNYPENLVLSCSQEYQGWVLGPDSTAVDAVERWGYMF